MNSSGLKATLRWSARMLASSSKNGKLWRIIQTRLGRKIRKARAPPSSSHLLHSSLRAGVSSKPAMSAAPKSSIVCLFSSPSPASPPKASHSRVLPVLIIRIRTQAQPIQISGSTEFIER